MAIVAFTAFRVECDLCGCEVPGDGGTPWYTSLDAALEDLEAWDWHWTASMLVCCDCEIICDEVDDWIASLTAQGGDS